MFPTEPVISSGGFAHHGGRLCAAQQAFPRAPQPWIDLSTGINPTSYPAPRADRAARNGLPDTGDLSRLEACAANAFGASDRKRVAAVGGTEPALRLLPYVLTAKEALVAGPTYGSHADAWTRAGMETKVVTQAELEESGGLLSSSRDGPVVLILVNPNNPDGRIVDRPRLLRLHDTLAARAGFLVVDEAFAEVTPGTSVADLAGSDAAPRLLVLRSFGKFYGLAGLRLGFIVGAWEVIAKVRNILGDWPVSADALVAGLAAYADSGWAEHMRAHLKKEAARLDGILTRHGLQLVGGTTLYRLARADDAAERFTRLASMGILTRPFQHETTWLRFGLPGNRLAWQRLAQALRQGRP